MTRTVCLLLAALVVALLCARVLLLPGELAPRAPAAVERRAVGGALRPAVTLPEPAPALEATPAPATPGDEHEEAHPGEDDGCDCGEDADDADEPGAPLDRRALLEVVLRDDSPVRRAAALEALVRATPGLEVEVAGLALACSALEALARLDTDPDADLRGWDEVARALGGTNVSIRGAAQAALERASPAARAAATRTLREALERGDQEPAARQACLEALAALADEQTIAALAREAPPVGAPVDPLD